MIFKSTEFKVGFLVLAAAVVLVILLMSASNWPLSAGKELRFHFDFVNDIQVGAPVHLAGVKIGKITKVSLLGSEHYKSDDAHPETPHAVEIRARINPRFVLRKGCKVTISTLGFVGESYLEITNGPLGQPELTADEPIVADNPISIADLLEKFQITADIAMKTVRLAQETVAKSQDDLNNAKTKFSHSIADLKQFIGQTRQSTEKTLENVNELLVTLNQIASKNGKQLDNSLVAFNRILNQVETDSGNISKQIEKMTQELSLFIEKNAGNVDKIVADAMYLSTQLKNVTQELNADIPELKEKFSNLLERTQHAVDTETPKVDKFVEKLTEVASNMEKTVEKINQIADRFQNSEGTVAKLLDDPSGFDQMRQTLNSAQETMAEISSLSRKIDKKIDTLKVPDLSYDYELRYRSLSEIFRNEFALRLLSSKNRLYRMGLSVQGEDVNYELQFGQRLGNFTARVGFIRSKVGLGFDYWLLPQLLGLTLEGINITTKTPEMDFEVLLRFLPNWGIVIGAEYIILEPSDFAGGDFGFNAGIRAVY